MEKNVSVCQSTTMEMQSNGGMKLSQDENSFIMQQHWAQDTSHDDHICIGNQNGEEICREGEEGCQMQEQSQWTSQVHKLTAQLNTNPSSLLPWSKWSRFYLHGLADVLGQPPKELFKRVDKSLQSHDENVHAYTPQTFSLGPFHAKPIISEQDRLKLSTVCSVFGVSSEVFNQLVQKIEKNIHLFTRLYDEVFQQDSQTLAVIFAVDAVCIVAHLSYGVNGAFQHRSFARDVILVENQIPVFVLKYAIQSMNAAQGNMIATEITSEQLWQQLTAIVCNLLKKFSPFPHMLQEHSAGYCELCELHVKKNLDEHRALLGLLYDALTRDWSSNDDCKEDTEEDPAGSSEKEERQYRMPGAFQLEKHGLKFEAHKFEARNFTGILFDDAAGTLKLPKIHEMNKYRQTFLLNLVAYEQNVAGTSNYKPVTSYVRIMGALMKEERDVEVLLRSGIVMEKEKPEAKKVAKLWQEMVSYVESLPHARTKVEKGVRDFTGSKLNRFRAAMVSLWRGC